MISFGDCVELVGLPGSGKTTLANIIRQRCPCVQFVETPYFRKADYAWFFASNALAAMPGFLSLGCSQPGQFLTPRDFALMTILTGWPRRLNRQAFRTNKVRVLDEGPVCYLTRLHAFNRGALQQPSARPWWDRTFKRWDNALRLLIHLDAPDELLARRIRQREAWQEIKEMSEEDGIRFLARLRASQEYVLSRLLSGTSPPTVISFDTATMSTESIYEDIGGLLSGQPRAAVQPVQVLEYLSESAVRRILTVIGAPLLLLLAESGGLL